jgi:phospholipid transport system substrate-binding protein
VFLAGARTWAEGVAGGGVAAVSPPSAAVDRLHADLLGVLRQADEIGYRGRYERLEAILARALELPFMAEKVIGGHWKTLDDRQRARWVRSFSSMTTANYASRFDHFDGQSFERLGEDPGTHETVMVRSRVLDPGGEPVELTYRLRATADGWKVVDVYLKGTVSELALRRSEYASVLDRDGFDALVAGVDAKVAELAQGTVRTP